MADSRTASAVAKVVSAVQEDIGEVIDLLTRGLEKMRDLEGHAKGINGLAGLLKAKAAEVELVISVLTEESESVAKKMLTEPRKEITQRVDEAQADAVRSAKARAQ